MENPSPTRALAGKIPNALSMRSQKAWIKPGFLFSYSLANLRAAALPLKSSPQLNFPYTGTASAVIPK